MSGYDEARSQVSDDKLSEWLTAEIVEDLQSVPGVGAKAAEKLAKEMGDEPGVTTTYQLLGKFLSFRGAGMDSQAVCDAMWHWLNSKGVSSHRAGIVHCIAEKVNLFCPGMYDAQ